MIELFARPARKHLFASYPQGDGWTRA